MRKLTIIIIVFAISIVAIACAGGGGEQPVVYPTTIDETPMPPTEIPVCRWEYNPEHPGELFWAVEVCETQTPTPTPEK